MRTPDVAAPPSTSMESDRAVGLSGAAAAPAEASALRGGEGLDADRERGDAGAPVVDDHAFDRTTRLQSENDAPPFDDRSGLARCILVVLRDDVAADRRRRERESA